MAAQNPPPSDLKQTLREKARRRLSISSLTKHKQQKSAQLADNDIDEIAQNVNVQVRQREPISPEKERSKIDFGALRQGLDTLKRPLSGLLRRPGSRSGSRERPAASQAFVDNSIENVDLVPTPQQQKPTSVLGEWPPAGGSQAILKKKTDTWLDNAAKFVSRPGSSAGNRKSSKGAASDGVGHALKVMVDGSVPTDDPALGFTLVEASNLAQDGGEELANVEELHSMEFGASIAQAPNIAVNTVSSYQDLDGELSRHAVFQSLDGIDLSLLTKCLCPENDVRDENAPWTWDYLYTTVCSELRQDWEQNVVEMEEPPAET